MSMSSIPSAMSSAVSGMNNAATSVANRAQRITQDTSVSASVDGNTDPVSFSTDVTADIVGLGLDKAHYKANAAVIRTLDQMEKQLLDIIA
jgi:hypothetical protein